MPPSALARFFAAALLLSTAPALAAGSACRCSSHDQQPGGDGLEHGARPQQRQQQMPEARQQALTLNVKALPGAADALLSSMRAAGNSSSPATWSAALAGAAGAAAADALAVPRGLLRVALDASLSVGLLVPSRSLPALTAEASDALAGFLQDAAGAAQQVLVGLNLVPAPASAHPEAASGNNASVLALASLTSAHGDLRGALELAAAVQQRCAPLLARGATLSLAAAGNGSATPCAPRLARWLATAADGSTVAPAGGLAGGPGVVVLVPLTVAAKLTISLPLPRNDTDAAIAISSARLWLQGPALAGLLQAHGLRVSAGSPARLVTLLSAAARGHESGHERGGAADETGRLQAVISTGAAAPAAGEESLTAAGSALAPWTVSDLLPAPAAEGSRGAPVPSGAAGASGSDGSGAAARPAGRAGGHAGAVAGAAAAVAGGLAVAAAALAALRRWRAASTQAVGGCAGGADGSRHTAAAQARLVSQTATSPSRRRRGRGGKRSLKYLPAGLALPPAQHQPAPEEALAVQQASAPASATTGRSRAQPEPSVTRAELCSDSVSSAARMDLTQALSRAASDEAADGAAGERARDSSSSSSDGRQTASSGGGTAAQPQQALQGAVVVLGLADVGLVSAVHHQASVTAATASAPGPPPGVRAGASLAAGPLDAAPSAAGRAAAAAAASPFSRYDFTALMAEEQEADTGPPVPGPCKIARALLS